MSKENLTTKELVEITKAIKNIEAGSESLADQVVVEKFFIFIPRNVMCELKERIRWGIIVLDDFGNQTNKQVGDFIFSLKENENRFKFRIQYLEMMKNRRQPVSNTVLKTVLADNLSDELYMIFSNPALENKMNNILLDYFYKCTQLENEPAWSIISGIPFLPADIIEIYKDKLDWETISICHEKTDDFMFQFYKWLDIEKIEETINDYD